MDSRIGNAGEVDQRVADLAVFGLALGGIGQLLEAAAAANGNVGAGRDDALGGGLDHSGDLRLGVTPFDAGDPRLDPIAGKATLNKNHPAFVPSDSGPAQGEIQDGKL